jgi:hypothetical protein
MTGQDRSHDRDASSHGATGDRGIDGLGEALRTMFAVTDPVPPATLAAASAAFLWRDVDAQLAALTSDSLIETTGPAVRGTPPRMLTFTTDTLTIDLEVAEFDGQVRILGQLSPARAADVRIDWAQGSRSVAADARGRFSAERLSAGWLRVSVESAERCHTEWIRI